MGTDPTGVKAVLCERAGGDLTAQPPPNGEPPGDVEPDMFGGLALLGELQGPEGRKRAGPGRPPGARNKQTAEWAEYILARHRSPLIGLAEVVSTPVHELATALGCKRIEAAEFWRKCAKDLAEYVHQKAPVQLQINEQFAGALLIIDKTGQMTDRAGKAGLGELLTGSAENRQSEAPEKAKSHDE